MMNSKYGIFLMMFWTIGSWAGTRLPVLDNFFPAEKNINQPVNDRPEKVDYTIWLPRDVSSIAKEQTMPLFLVLDQQNNSIYKNTIYTIDYLTSLSNLPASAILSVGFQDGMERFLLSRYGAEGGGLEAFMETLKKWIEDAVGTYNLQLSSVVVIGHSRTGYIASQLLFQFPETITAAIVGSAQELRTEKELATFDQFLEVIEEKKLKRYFFFSSGKESMGDGDESSTVALIDFFKKQESDYLTTCGKVYDCDHYNSLGIQLNGALLNLFNGYNLALQESFDLLNSGKLSDYNAADFEAIYARISQSSGIQFDRDITFYISMFYGFLNDYQNQFGDKADQMAEKVLAEGMARYTNDYRFIPDYVYLLLEKGEQTKAEAYFAANMAKFETYKWIDEEGLMTEIKAVTDLFAN